MAADGVQPRQPNYPEMVDCVICRKKEVAKRRPGYRMTCADCSQCKARFCVSCSGPWFETHSCRVFRRRHEKFKDLEWFCRKADQIDDFRENLEPHGFKMCPGCFQPVIKDNEDDCDHIFCSNPECRMEFCWQCMANRKVVEVHGNHHHRPQCPYYFEFTGKDTYMPEKCDVCRKNERCCITPLVWAKMSKAQREGYPEEGWTAYAIRKEKELEEKKLRREAHKRQQEGGFGAFMQQLFG
ncbi:unnamed protein product [Effrenium voratum]|uniref:RING-type domain-containing protein n=1 Tax=Effrenium voratum TaxID=2562239 RepID=A0AA36JGQ3_9DINO|nr:unnamed protein product [Effrenium voratum]CAJ1405326.1 unnamed protein product [Effrenium voratum]